MIENLPACAPARTKACFHRTSAEVDLILKFRTGETWAVGINRGLSPVLKPGFFSALADVAPDEAFVVDGDEETIRAKSGIEFIGLRPFQEAPQVREQPE